MANDVLSSRREARRRRILENSENRLQKITGRSDNISKVTYSTEDDSLEFQNGRFSRQMINGSVQLAADCTQIHYDYCSLEHKAKIDCMENKADVPKYLDTHSTTSGLFQDQEAAISAPSTFYFLYAAKLHLICLAVLVRIMYIIDYGFIFGESLVAPLCVVEMTNILWLRLNKQQMQSPGLLDVFLLFSGISSHKVTLILNCIQMLSLIVQDTCIYLFTFVTFHAILVMARNVEHSF